MANNRIVHFEIPANQPEVEARAEFERAAMLTRNARERQLLLDRAVACSRKASPAHGDLGRD
jgi:hypothetical protein